MSKIVKTKFECISNGHSSLLFKRNLQIICKNSRNVILQTHHQNAVYDPTKH